MPSAASSDQGPPSKASDDERVLAAPAADAGSAGVQTPIDYIALFEAVKDKPCRVRHINQAHIGSNGSRFRTRAELIERELEPIYSARTLSEVHTELDAAGKRLQQLGIFSSIDILAHEEPLNDPSACSVEVQLEESNWFRVRASTYVQAGESTFELMAGLNNAAGRAEKLDAQVEYGAQNSHLFSLAYTQPRIAGQRQQLEARGSQLCRNNQKASSFTEQLRGVVLGLRSMDGGRSLEYELGWRRLVDPSTAASRAVRAQMGDYLKSALRYTATLERRDPSAGGAAAAAGGAGWAVRSTTEVAGLLPPQQQQQRTTPAAASASLSSVGSTLRFVRQQLDAVANVPMDETGAVVFSVGLSAGLLVPWGDGEPLSRPTCIADRFFLGGASSLRGFKFRGVGPTDVRRPAARPEEAAQPPRRDALGGDLYTSVFASLMFQLPHPALKYLKLHGHAFVNGGNLVQLAGTGQAPAQVLREFGSSFRWTCGAGLVLPTPLGRFEANYCVLLAAQEHDRVKRGLQLGFAASPI